MRVSELYKQVAQLGFEDSLEDDSRFYYAANRALLQVSAIRPAVSAYIINHKPMANLLKENTFTPIERSEDLCFEATDAKSYYFEADGNGKVTVFGANDCVITTRNAAKGTNTCEVRFNNQTSAELVI